MQTQTEVIITISWCIKTDLICTRLNKKKLSLLSPIQVKIQSPNKKISKKKIENLLEKNFHEEELQKLKKSGIDNLLLIDKPKLEIQVDAIINK